MCNFCHWYKEELKKLAEEDAENAKNKAKQESSKVLTLQACSYFATLKFILQTF